MSFFVSYLTVLADEGISESFNYKEATKNAQNESEVTKKKNFTINSARGEKFTRTVLIQTDDEILPSPSYSDDPGILWESDYPPSLGSGGPYEVVVPGPKNVTFNNKQDANTISKLYTPYFTGKTKLPAGGGAGDEAEFYAWRLDSAYRITCDDKCQVGPDDVTVPRGYSMAVDEYKIKETFEYLLYRKENPEACDCSHHQNDHAIDWPDIIEEEFIVRCDHCSTGKCEQIGKITPVDVPFTVEVVPDNPFEGRATMKYGLLETAKIVAKSVPGGLPMPSVKFGLSSPGTTEMTCSETGIIEAKTTTGVACIWAQSSDSEGKMIGDRLVVPITVVAPSGFRIAKPPYYTVQNFAEYDTIGRKEIPPNMYVEVDKVTALSLNFAGMGVYMHVEPEDVSFEKIQYIETSGKREGLILEYPEAYHNLTPITFPRPPGNDATRLVDHIIVVLSTSAISGYKSTECLFSYVIGTDRTPFYQTTQTLRYEKQKLKLSKFKQEIESE